MFRFLQCSDQDSPDPVINYEVIYFLFPTIKKNSLQMCFCVITLRLNLLLLYTCSQNIIQHKSGTTKK